MPRPSSRQFVPMDDMELDLVEELRSPSSWTGDAGSRHGPVRGSSDVSSSADEIAADRGLAAASPRPTNITDAAPSLPQRAVRGLRQLAGRWTGRENEIEYVPLEQARADTPDFGEDAQLDPGHPTGGTAPLPLAARGHGGDEDSEPEQVLSRVSSTVQEWGSSMLGSWKRIIVAVLVLITIVSSIVYGVSVFSEVLHWFQARNNLTGWCAFLALYTVTVAVFLPGVVLIMGAGLVFGFWKALLAVWIGGSVGQALAFLLARYMLHDWVEDMIRSKWEKWEYIDRAIEHEGWKLVLIIRLSPVIPYNLLNIAMATTSMPLWQFTLVSSVGIVFECAIFSYVGSLAGSVTAIVAGESSIPSGLSWAFVGITICMCVVAVVFVTHMVKEAIQRAEDAAVEAGRTGRSLSRDLAAEPDPLSDRQRQDRPFRSTPPVSYFEMKAVARNDRAFGADTEGSIRHEPPMGVSDRLSTPATA